MVHLINNIIDIIWLGIGLIAIVVLIATFFPWRFLLELVVLTLLVIWIAVKFWLREGWRGIKKLFRKKATWLHIDEHNDLFI